MNFEISNRLSAAQRAVCCTHLLAVSYAAARGGVRCVDGPTIALEPLSAGARAHGHEAEITGAALPALAALPLVALLAETHRRREADVVPCRIPMFSNSYSNFWVIFGKL